MDGPAASGFRYRAFIAYSHRDQVWARWLHRALESYRVPRRLVGEKTEAGIVPARLLPVFRDREELPSAHDLTSKVNDALEQSANLIVICSPNAAASRWVNGEVAEFKRLGRVDRIFCLIVAGEPNASQLAGREAEECFPPALLFAVDMDGRRVPAAEPIAADLRDGMDGKLNAKLKLIAGLLGVGFDSLKHREQQRRVRHLTAIAVGSTAVMLVTAALAISAVVARHAAERRQKQAENLVDFMLGDLNEKLNKVQRLDLLEAVDDRAMAYFKSLPNDDLTGEAPALHALALRRIGSVRLDQGHLQAAMDSFQAGLKVAAALANASPTVIPKQIAYAEILSFIGMTYWRQGKLDDAQQAFESARTVLNRLQHLTPGANDSQVLFQLATTYNNIGHVLEVRGRLDDAGRQYQQMLAISKRLAALDPTTSTRWSDPIGLAHDNLGKLALMSGDLAGAIAEYTAENAIISAAAAADANDNNQRENMLTVRAILGRTLALADEEQAGTVDLEQAVETATQLAALDASNSNFQEDIGLYTRQLSRQLRLAGNLPQATELTKRSLAVMLALTRQDPANADWQKEYAETCIEDAELTRAAGKISEARAKARRALDLIDPVMTAQPDDRETLLAGAAAKLLLADVTENAPSAQQSLREDALRAIRSAKSGRGDPRLLALEVEALLALGRSAQIGPPVRQLWTSGYRDAALVYVLTRAGIEYPVNREFNEKLHAALQPASQTSVANATHLNAQGDSHADSHGEP
jgi:eukaryotic-like serine/threonine-protein kinase